jgi:hypothetical protein
MIGALRHAGWWLGALWRSLGRLSLIEMRRPVGQVSNLPAGNGGLKTRRYRPNGPCPCGSGRKFKRCCGRNAG